MTNIIEKLRLLVPSDPSGSSIAAIWEIQRLRAEVKKHAMDALLATDGNLMLAEENQRLRVENIQMRLEYRKKIAEQANEIERLRAALRAIIAVSSRHNTPTFNVITDTARAALEVK